MKFTILTALALFSTSTLAVAGRPPPPPTCGTCNPVSGQNSCDITTSCINTGTRFHCACRAGYKASTDNNNIHKQFRLNVPNYQFLVFTPESTECNTLCNNHNGAGPNLCAEVPIRNQCAV
ncbi:putative adhesin [Aspergillus affinis]|uniref:putative adhesin n=1 Tax=Aspergillus affinis TaxID=1070780 RepID=UPI0022FDF2A7|nr:adhesin [Aspergillus affinis]KAI9036715.1 adhesin [Aspergillus affinis]